jgi:hypothetical protein
MKTQETAQKQITEEVASWPRVKADYEHPGKFSFQIDRREIGHLHGRFAHFEFPKDVGHDLRKQGQVGPHPSNPRSSKLGERRIKDEDDVRDVVELMRLNYNRIAEQKTSYNKIIQPLEWLRRRIRSNAKSKKVSYFNLN